MSHRFGSGASCIFIAVLVLTNLAAARSMSPDHNWTQKSAGRYAPMVERDHKPDVAATSEQGFSTHASAVLSEPAGAVSYHAATDGECGFAGVCYSTIRAPEPQSLLLVGSGLIAMAGVVRRRLAR